MKRVEEHLESLKEAESYVSKYNQTIHIEPGDLICGDMLKEMNGIPDESVDMILTDLPYGTTSIKWDAIIPFSKLWKQYNRVIKPNGAIILFGSEPFSSQLRMSNIDNYKYDLVWEKEKPTNFFQLKRRVGKHTEYIHVFYKKQPIFNPQMRKFKGEKVVNKPKATHASVTSGVSNKKIVAYEDNGTRYPKDILRFNRVKLGGTVHPTQKPVPLLEWLIKTYSNEGDVVLDSTMGSGSTGVACVNTERQFIGIELDEGYFEIAKERIYKSKINKE